MMNKERQEILDKDGNFQASLEYYKNAKSILKKTKIEDGLFINRKPVQEACGTCYLAVLYAIDGYLLQYKMDQKNLPTSYDEYLKALRKVTVKNGKLIKIFKRAYHVLHIAGYYKGIQVVDIIKSGFSNAKWIIEHLTGKKV